MKYTYYVNNFLNYASMTSVQPHMTIWFQKEWEMKVGQKMIFPLSRKQTVFWKFHMKQQSQKNDHVIEFK